MATKKTHGSKGTKRPLTKKEDAIKAARQSVALAQGHLALAIGQLATAAEIGETTDNRPNVLKPSVRKALKKKRGVR